MKKHSIYITALMVAICFLSNTCLAEMSIIGDAALGNAMADIGMPVPQTLSIKMTTYSKSNDGSFVPSGKIHLKIHMLSGKTPEMVQQEKSMADFIAYNSRIVNNSSIGIFFGKEDLYRHLYPDISGDTTTKLIPGTGLLYENFNYYAPNADVNRSIQLLDDHTTTTTRITSDNSSITITTQDSTPTLDFSR